MCQHSFVISKYNSLNYQVEVVNKTSHDMYIYFREKTPERKYVVIASGQYRYFPKTFHRNIFVKGMFREINTHISEHFSLLEISFL